MSVVDDVINVFKKPKGIDLEGLLGALILVLIESERNTKMALEKISTAVDNLTAKAADALTEIAKDVHALAEAVKADGGNQGAALDALADRIDVVSNALVATKATVDAETDSAIPPTQPDPNVP